MFLCGYRPGGGARRAGAIPRSMPPVVASGRIDSAGMLHGAPDEQAYLKPTSGGKTMRGKRAVFVTRWTFDVPHGVRDLDVLRLRRG